jgi:hypothetical protein
VLGFGQAGLHQHRGHGHPHAQLHRVQREHADIQAQQVGVCPNVGQAPLRCGGLRMLRGLGRHPPQHHGHARERERAGQAEQARKAYARGQRRRRHERNGKHQADAAAHERHGLGAHAVARLVGQQRRDGG